MPLPSSFAVKLAVRLSLVFVAVGTGGVAKTISLPVPQKAPASSSVVVNPKDYGAIADGLSHPLRKIYSSLAAAQAVYPFITSLSQELDYAAIKAASNAAFGADGAEHGRTFALNKPIYLPPGGYMLGDDTWRIRNAMGIHIYGAGRLTTTIFSNKTVFRTDGLWYSRIERIKFASQKSDAVVAVDIDGNVSGAYETIGTQGNTFSDLLIDAGDSEYGFALNRQGGNAAQGDQNEFWNCHFTRASFALYFQNGYNTMNTSFYGGDFQEYSKFAIYLLYGSINLFSPSFESGAGYKQILNGGWDINATAGGVHEEIIVDGARTESLRFYNGGYAQYAIIRGLNHAPGLGWKPKTAYGPDKKGLFTAVIGYVGDAPKLFQATVGGTSGLTEPKWPATGIVKEGPPNDPVTWTQRDFEVVHLDAGILQNPSHISVGDVKLADNSQQLRTIEVRANYIASPLDDVLLVDATKEDIFITLPAAFKGKTYMVKKWDSTPHRVRISSGERSGTIDMVDEIIIPGGSRGYVTLVKAGGGNITGGYWVVAKSF